MPSNHFILCCPLLLPPSIVPRIKVFPNESVLCIRWPKYWSFSFSINPSNEYSGLISFVYETIIEAESSRQYNVSTVGGSNVKLKSKQILMLGLLFFFLLRFNSRDDWTCGIPGCRRIYRLRLFLGCCIPNHINNTGRLLLFWI